MFSNEKNKQTISGLFRVLGRYFKPLFVFSLVPQNEYEDTVMSVEYTKGNKAIASLAEQGHQTSQ